MAVVLIGLAVALVAGFVGRATSDVFDEVGDAFPAELLAAPLGDDLAAGVFDDLFARIEDIDSLGSSLADKAREAESRYRGGDLDGAVATLNSLIKEVDAQQGKQLSHDEAASVRNGAQKLIEIIGSG